MNFVRRVFPLLCLCLMATVATFSATFTVTKVADTNDGVCDADCSFREAVAAANAAAGDDIIVFSSLFNTPQTIVLSGTEIIIGSNGALTIIGPGANLLTLDGNQASRILVTGANVNATIEGIRFTRGNGVGATNTGRGGAIYNVGGTLTIRNSILTNNTAANGGAINNAASASPNPVVNADLTIFNCIISNNSSTSSGGAMQNFSTSTFRLYSSTVSGNTSATGGGGAMQANGSVIIANSTFAGNTSQGTTGGGAIVTNGSLFNMTNSTVSGNTSATNGGGIHRSTTNVNGFIRNSIIAGNTGPSPDVSNSANGLQSQGNNIIGAVGTSTGWVGSDLLNTNPMLGTLGDNGGFGQTFVPQPGSPAINGGQNCVLDASCSANNLPINLTTDQRGISRPQGTSVDIGAVEVAASASNVSVGGRVFASNGQAVRGAIVTISTPPTLGTPVIQSVTTNNFGYFTFTGIPSGASYQLNVFAKGLEFNAVTIQVSSDINDLVLTATNNNLSGKDGHR